MSAFVITSESGEILRFGFVPYGKAQQQRGEGELAYELPEDCLCQIWSAGDSPIDLVKVRAYAKAQLNERAVAMLNSIDPTDVQIQTNRMIKLTEAKAAEMNPDAVTPLLTQESIARDIPRGQLIVEILNAAANNDSQRACVEAQRVKLRGDVDRSESLAEIFAAIQALG